MRFLVNPFSIVSLFGSLVFIIIIGIMWGERNRPGAKYFLLMMLSIIIWTIGDALENAVVGIPNKIFWGKVQYPSTLSTSVLLLLFSLEFTQKKHWLNRTRITALFIVPMITLALAITNERHGLIWPSVTSSPLNPNIAVYGHGPGFWLGTILYSNLALLSSTIILLHSAIREKGRNFLKLVVIVLAVLPPWVVSLMYAFGNNPVPGLELTPLASGISGVLFAVAILSFRLFDLVPIARNEILELITDGILIFDDSGNLRDSNSTGKLFFDMNTDFVGLPRQEVLSKYPEILAFYEGSENRVEDLKLNGPDLLVVDIVKEYFPESATYLSGTLLIIRNVTQKYLDHITTAENERKLAMDFQRRKMAMDIHDSIMQSFYSFGLLIDTTKQLVAQNDTDQALEMFSHFEKTHKQLIGEMRLLIFELQPRERAGTFQDQIASRLAQVEGQAGLEITTQIDENICLSEERSNELILIIYEALNNIIKHAYATKVNILLAEHPDHFKLQITDNGKGFDQEHRKSNGFGLENMKERSNYLHADLAIRSTPMGGTEISLSVPKEG